MGAPSPVIRDFEVSERVAGMAEGGEGRFRRSKLPVRLQATLGFNEEGIRASLACGGAGVIFFVYQMTRAAGQSASRIPC